MLSSMDPKIRKNKPRNKARPSTWPNGVWQMFEHRLIGNVNTKGEPYYRKVSFSDCPPELASEVCWYPVGANFITVCDGNEEFQRPLHRMTVLLEERRAGREVSEELQASHLCPDAINVDGKGAKHCCNPRHMCLEDDKANKSRQRCAGWIWLHKMDENRPGGYWYPTCTHSPPCLRFTSKEAQKPSYFAEKNIE